MNATGAGLLNIVNGVQRCYSECVCLFVCVHEFVYSCKNCDGWGNKNPDKNPLGILEESLGSHDDLGRWKTALRKLLCKKISVFIYLIIKDIF